MLCTDRKSRFSYTHSLPPNKSKKYYSHSPVAFTSGFPHLQFTNIYCPVFITLTSKKIASGIGAIKRIRPFVSPEILHYIYNALVQPHFDYCGIVWGNCGKTLSERLQKLQNRAARILTSSS